MGFLLGSKPKASDLPPIQGPSTPTIEQIGDSPEDERARALRKAKLRKGQQASLLAGRKKVGQTLGAPGDAAAVGGASLLGGR